MQKKNALGTDPLSWLKEKDKKENSENTESNINGKEKLTEKPLEPKDVDGISAKSKIKEAKATGVSSIEKALNKIKYEPVGVSGTNKLREEKADEPGGITETNRKAVAESSKKIKYEPVGVTGTNKLQEEKADEPGGITEANRKVVLGKDVYENHAKPRETTHKDSPATAFVIVYTVLLLILGFIVYRDLTKQIDRLETKLEIVEKHLDAGLINYEDTKLNDVW